MSKVVVFTNVTLDGVIQAPGAFVVLRLVSTETTTNGVVIATYQPAEPTAGKVT